MSVLRVAMEGGEDRGGGLFRKNRGSPRRKDREQVGGREEQEPVILSSSSARSKHQI